MPLPHGQITPIPNTEPDAVPALWNVRYEEIDDNFAYLEQQRQATNSSVSAVASEVAAARDGSATLDVRLEAMQDLIANVQPDAQTAMLGELIALRGQTGLLDREIQQIRKTAHQEGVFELRNRGLIYGGNLTKNLVHARTLDISEAQFFLGGRLYSIASESNTTSVAGNGGTAAATCWSYLQIVNGVARCNTTLPGELPPADSVPIYQITIPAGNTEANDPYLSNVTLSKIARTEPNWPRLQVSPAFIDVVLPRVMSAADYLIDLDVLGHSGATPELIVTARANNGFRVYLGGSADRVSVRYLASLMKQ
jgi:hypothetical protein